MLFAPTKYLSLSEVDQKLWYNIVQCLSEFDTIPSEQNGYPHGKRYKNLVQRLTSTTLWSVTKSFVVCLCLFKII